jgi:hypothetical protein
MWTMMDDGSSGSTQNGHKVKKQLRPALVGAAPGAFVQRLGQLGLGHRMPTASGGHQSEWSTISNQCYTFAAVVAVYNHTEPGRSGLLSEAIDLLIRKIMCIGQVLGSSTSIGASAALRHHPSITRQYHYKADYTLGCLGPLINAPRKTEADKSPEIQDC